MKRRWLALFLWLCGQSGVAAAAPPTPSVRALGFFQGSWTCAGSFSNGKKIAATMKFESALGGEARLKQHDDKAPDVYHALEVDPHQQFAYSRLDERTFQVEWRTSSDGKVYAVGDTLTCHRA